MLQQLGEKAMHRDSNEEFMRLKRLLLKRYYERSVIEEALETRDYKPNSDDTKEFRQIGASHRFDTDVFADPTHYLDLFFDQAADSLILGEKKYLVDTMLKQETIPKYMERFTYDGLVEMISSKFGASEPSIIFMPLTLFSRVHMEWAIGLNKGLDAKDGHYRVILPVHSYRPQLVWSNKYMPFDSIVVTSKQVGEWIAKPKVNDRVRVTRSDDAALHVYSVFHFQVRDPEQVLKIEVNPEELDKKRLDELTKTPIE
jgi:hypothetical protein